MNRLLILLVCCISVGCSSSKTKMDELSEGEKARLYVELANASIRESDPTAALIHLKKAEELAPGSPSVLHAKALAYSAKRMDKEALKYAKEAAEKAPKYSAAQTTYGRLLLKENKTDRRSEIYLKRAAEDPLNRAAYRAKTNLGILYYNLGRLGDAKKQLDMAILENPNDTCIANYYVGHIALKEKNFDKSIKSYRRASQRECGKFSDAQYALGIAYLRQGEPELARKQFLEVARIYPDTPAADRAIQSLRKLP